VRHPDYDALSPRGTIGGAPRDGAMRWQSKTHPFGLSRETASVGVTFGKTAIDYHGFEKVADVRVWDRLGADAGLAVSVYGPTLGSYAIEFDVTTVEATIGRTGTPCPREDGTGDERLKVMPGGWRFEEGTLRVNVLRNGALASVFRKCGDRWLKVIGEAGFYTNTGTGRKVNTGEIPSDCKQAYECECPVRIRRTADGAIKLDFVDGELRSFGRHSSRMAKPVRFSTYYTFKGDSGFGYCTRMQTTRAFEKGSGILDWRMDLVDCKGGKTDGEGVLLDMGFGGKLEMKLFDWKGEKPRQVVRYGNRLHAVWLGKSTEGLDLPATSQNGFTASISVGEVLPAPAKTNVSSCVFGRLFGNRRLGS